MEFVTTQRNEKDCAFSSYKMLMATLYNDSKYLNLEPHYVKSRYSLLDIVNFAKEDGVKLIAYKVIEKTEFDFKNTNLPCLIEFNLVNGEKHLVLLKEIKKNRFKILDSANGVYYLNVKEFNELWNGIILVPDKVQAKKEIKEKKKINFKMLFPLTCEILSTVSIFLGFYFMGSNSSIIPSLICFLSYFGFFLLSHHTYSRYIEDLDYKLLDKPNSRYFISTNLDKITDYKVLSLTNNASFINNVLLVGGLGVILVLNLSINLYLFIGTIALCFIERLMFDKIIATKKKDISKEEIMLRNNNINDKQFGGYYLKLSYNSRKLYNMLLLKRWFGSLIIFIGCFLMMVFSEYFAINYLGFYFVAFMVIHEKFNDILEFRNKKTKEKTLESLVNNNF